MAILTACLVVGLPVAWWDGWTTGFITSLLLCLICSAAVSLGEVIDHPALLVPAAILGAVLHRHPLLAGLAFFIGIAAIAFFHRQFLLEFTLPLIALHLHASPCEISLAT